MTRYRYLIFLLFFLFACGQKSSSEGENSNNIKKSQVEIKVLGIAQDAGYPQMGCRKSCCINLWNNIHLFKRVSCLGIRDTSLNRHWLIDATPDINQQSSALLGDKGRLTGIFLTHAHIGHYTGLMQLGREAMGAENVEVYAMPRMDTFLRNNGPWRQLVELQNIKIKKLRNQTKIHLTPSIDITPIEVPHRDEFSETAGFLISGPNRSLLYIPDIDKWQLWDEDILEYLERVDYAFLDGTFFANGEIAGRDMSLIPHPFIEESMLLFESLPEAIKKKVYFIHFNHTNPVLQKGSKAYKKVIDAGYNIAEEGMQLFL